MSGKIRPVAVFSLDGMGGHLLTWHRTGCPQMEQEIRRGLGALLTAPEGMLLPRTGILFKTVHCLCLGGKVEIVLANIAVGVDTWETVADNREESDW